MTGPANKKESRVRLLRYSPDRLLLVGPTAENSSPAQGILIICIKMLSRQNVVKNRIVNCPPILIPGT